MISLFSGLVGLIYIQLLLMINLFNHYEINCILYWIHQFNAEDDTLLIYEIKL